MRTRDDYVFFFGTSHKNGWASQWYPAEFTAIVQIGGKDETVDLPTAEHWMMLQKALLFDDIAVARSVIQAVPRNLIWRTSSL
ncbi:hypothetical protein HGRIS_000486 [Hohenbuehelia grisea]|uniref:NADAR domain-containing protein n=1 Tax=Hohenbuehelia grisea TaxID=104357 RepID=A0ABR3JRZ3_9AGAR